MKVIVRIILVVSSIGLALAGEECFSVGSQSSAYTFSKDCTDGNILYIDRAYYYKSSNDKDCRAGDQCSNNDVNNELKIAYTVGRSFSGALRVPSFPGSCSGQYVNLFVASYCFGNTNTYVLNGPTQQELNSGGYFFIYARYNLYNDQNNNPSFNKAAIRVPGGARFVARVLELYALTDKSSSCAYKINVALNGVVISNNPCMASKFSGDYIDRNLDQSSEVTVYLEKMIPADDRLIDLKAWLMIEIRDSSGSYMPAGKGVSIITTATTSSTTTSTTTTTTSTTTTSTTTTTTTMPPTTTTTTTMPPTTTTTTTMPPTLPPTIPHTTTTTTMPPTLPPTIPPTTTTTTTTTTIPTTTTTPTTAVRLPTTSTKASTIILPTATSPPTLLPTPTPSSTDTHDGTSHTTSTPVNVDPDLVQEGLSTNAKIGLGVGISILLLMVILSTIGIVILCCKGRSPKEDRKAITDRRDSSTLEMENNGYTLEPEEPDVMPPMGVYVGGEEANSPGEKYKPVRKKNSKKQGLTGLIETFSGDPTAIYYPIDDSKYSTTNSKKISQQWHQNGAPEAIGMSYPGDTWEFSPYSTVNKNWGEEAIPEYPMPPAQYDTGHKRFQKNSKSNRMAESNAKHKIKKAKNVTFNSDPPSYTESQMDRPHNVMENSNFMF